MKRLETESEAHSCNYFVLAYNTFIYSFSLVNSRHTFFL